MKDGVCETENHLLRSRCLRYLQPWIRHKQKVRQSQKWKMTKVEGVYFL